MRPVPQIMPKLHNFSDDVQSVPYGKNHVFDPRIRRNHFVEAQNTLGLAVSGRLFGTNFPVPEHIVGEYPSSCFQMRKHEVIVLAIALTEEQWMDMDALLTEYRTILLDDACDYFVEGVQVGFGLAQDLLCR